MSEDKLTRSRWKRRKWITWRVRRRGSLNVLKQLGGSSTISCRSLEITRVEVRKGQHWYFISC
jgi:hypothetical protein